MPTPKAALAADTLSREKLGRAIIARVEALGLNREQTAKIVDDAASQVSRLMCGNFHEFSAERMATWLTRLGVAVELTVRLDTPSRRFRRARTIVHA